jgi:general L-amino acid transport system permease protein
MTATHTASGGAPPSAPSTTRPPLWRNIKVLAWTFQIGVLTLVVVGVAILVNNVRVNSAQQGIPTNFDFLDQPAGFPIPASDFRTTETVQKAMVEGALNTLRVVVVGLIASTLLGVALGIGRLSGNWLVRKIATVYVEVIRNIPLLGLIIFAYLAIVLSVLPRVEKSWRLDGVLIANGRGVSVPWFTGSTIRLLAAVAVAGIAAYGVKRWRQRAMDARGETPHFLLWVVPPFALICFWGAVVAGTGVTIPSLEGRRVLGGITLQPEYFALLAALVIYTSSHIAEIVRGSIQAVPKGQQEAASAMALSGGQRMQYVILPQAMRIALPPLGNQYLNLLKNSSLGLVISYFEVTKVAGTTIGNRSPAVPTYLLLMTLYLIASLIISGIVNILNRRLATP